MYVLLIDIGSGSVGLALTLITRGAAPVVQFAIRQELPLQKKPNASRLLYMTIKVLRALVLQYQIGGHPNPSEIHCYLSSHLAISQTRVINLQFDEPRVVNRSLIDTIIDSELNLFKAENRHQYKGQTVLIDNKLMSVKLNGYSISEIDSRRVGELELAVFFSMITIDIESEIRHAIVDSFHHANLKTHSFLFANFAVTRDTFKDIKDFVLIDIGG